jgi:hypothetical protein
MGVTLPSVTHSIYIEPRSVTFLHILQVTVSAAFLFMYSGGIEFNSPFIAFFECELNKNYLKLVLTEIQGNK